MATANKNGQSASAAAPAPAEFKMPRPPGVVVWRNAPGGEANYAIVTRYGRHAVSVMVFPPESRVGVPKDSVRYVGDPWNAKNGINGEAGVWDYTDEHKVVSIVARVILEDEKSCPRFDTGAIEALLRVTPK